MKNKVEAIEIKIKDENTSDDCLECYLCFFHKEDIVIKKKVGITWQFSSDDTMLDDQKQLEEVAKIFLQQIKISLNLDSLKGILKEIKERNKE